MSDPCPNLTFDAAPEMEWPEAESVLLPVLVAALFAAATVVLTVLSNAFDGI